MSATIPRQRAPASPWNGERTDLDRRAFAALIVMAAPETTPRARDAARDQVIGLYLPLAHRLARRYHGGGEPMDDLVQVAAIGLIRAVDRFDARKGETFAAYAIPTIVGELRRHFRDRAYDVRIPRRLQEHAMRVRSAAGDLAQRLRRTPGVADLARHLGLSEDEVIEAMAVGDVRTALSIDSLNGPIPPSGTPRERVGAVDPELENVESRTMVRSLLAELPARERRIVWLRFFEERTQSAIADEVGLSQMHVSRLLSRALETMRRGAAS